MLVLKEGTVHFIGIGGAGMSGIAQILLELGVSVSGSDIAASEITKRLEKLGGRVYIGHHQDHVTADVEKIVFSTAIKSDNPELEEGRRRGLPIMQRAEMLAEIMALKTSIAVAGAHGKTTTTAMVSLMLETNKWDPTIVIGGDLKQIGGNAKFGRSEYLVAEADESDGSFLKLFPKIAIITNIENDHLDYYQTVDNIIRAFHQFVRQLPPDGFAVICADDRELMRIAKTVPGRYITYALKNNIEADFTVKNVSFSGVQSKSDVYFRGEKLGTLVLQVPGMHNISNALAAIAVGMEIGLTFDQAVAGLKPFTGVKRRFEFIDEVNGITIVDDYAHHPTELQATLKAAKNTGYKRVIAVFQPHRYTRTKFLYKEFGASFPDADLVVINEIYAASEQPIPGITAELIVDAIKTAGNVPVAYCITEEELLGFLVQEVRPGDLVLTLGAGNIWRTGIKLADRLRSTGR